MKRLPAVFACLLVLSTSFSQGRVKAEKYPSLLWEITGKGLQKPSYLFGTMHVSSKMVFHLSDSFYLAIRNAQVVALETNPGTWQEDFSRYDLDGEGMRSSWKQFHGGLESAPQDYLTINSLRLTPFDKELETALYNSPSLINSFLYRNNAETSADFEEDTYLDLHIFQTGRKLGKRVCGVENFDGSMQLVKEAYADAAREKNKRQRFASDDEFSYARMEEAYRTGNLDLLDTINKTNSQSAAFDEKFLYRRNEIQAASIDSILRSGTALFAGVGAAHLPGIRGVIEWLRRKGYRLRPVKMQEHDSRYRDDIERMKVPVKFSLQMSADGFYSVAAPGKLYSFGQNNAGMETRQFADMINGSYYLVTRIMTNAAIMGLSEAQVAQKLDSVLYENIPGRILSKKPIVKNGYRGFDITNRTRRGDVQRYNIFITPVEVIVFKLSGTGDYVKTGTEAAQFFNSIQLTEAKPEWKKWSPAGGGFVAEWPQQPLVFKGGDWVYAAYDAGSRTAYEVIRTEVHNHRFLEEDSFDLDLMEESFAASEGIARSFFRRHGTVNGYPMLEVSYRCKDSSLTTARFLLQGPHYYTVLVHAPSDHKGMQRFLRSFSIASFAYGKGMERVDTAMHFRVQSPVALEKKNKLPLYPVDALDGNDDADDSLLNTGVYRSRVLADDSTGEQVFLSFYKPSPYVSREKKPAKPDPAETDSEWVFRKQRRDTLANGLHVYEYELGKANSSRLLKRKVFSREGAGYRLETETDTLSTASRFLNSVFTSFEPLDDLHEVDAGAKKTGLFFSQLFSGDTALRKKALANSSLLSFDSTDFSQLKQGIESLSWKDKNYFDIKKAMVGKLGAIKANAASAYLKTLYAAAGDTLELQYAALEALLSQQTEFAYRLFGQIMQADPPVLDRGLPDDAFLFTGSDHFSFHRNKAAKQVMDGQFMDDLSDSLELSAGIFTSLLPLITIQEYEMPVMKLMAQLLEKRLIRPQAYEAYLPKLLLEAKQALKKQLTGEKNKAIEAAQKAGNEKNNEDEEHSADSGNDRLVLYAGLLLPFREQNPPVAALLQQLLHSRDKRLQYETALLLLRGNLQVPDTLLGAFASSDAYRYRLYEELKSLRRDDLFPAAEKTPIAMARSRLVNLDTDNKPDTIAYLDKLPLCYKEVSGFLYFFMYKEKKEEAGWRLATVGLLPADTSQVELAGPAVSDEGNDFNFTQLTGTRLTTERPLREQLETLRKKLLYGRRKSAARFYQEGDRYEEGVMGPTRN